MGMVDVAKNIKSTMEDLKKPRPRAASRSSSLPKSSLSPWAWRASQFFWRRLVKKNPPKRPVIKSPISASPSSHCPPCKKGKFVPNPTKKYTNHHTTNNNLFYYSYPNHNSNDDVNFVSNNIYEYYDVVKSKVRSRPSSGCVTPTTCDYTTNLINKDYHNTLPYFQLRHSQRVPLPGSTGRLPLYIVS